MYNAGVSPEALQQVKNEGQREAVRKNANTKIFNNTKPPFFCNVNKARRNDRKQKTVEEKENWRRGKLKISQDKTKSKRKRFKDPS